MIPFMLFLSAAAVGATLSPTSDAVLLAGGEGGGPIRYEYGYFVSADAMHNTVSAYRSDGQVMFDRTLEIPGVYHLQIRYAAVSPEGWVAVSAGAYSEDAAHVSVLIWVRPDGTVARAVRTSPYAPNQMVFAPDGSLWTLGRLKTADNNGDVPDGAVMRHYDRNGQKIGEALPLSGFPAMHETRTARYPPAAPFWEAVIFPGLDRLGLFCPGMTEYIELSWDGAVLGRWRTAPISEDSPVWAAAFGKEGAVVALVGATSRTLDKGTGNFIPMETGSERIGNLAGGDGTRLLFRTDTGKYMWFEQK